MHRAWFAPLIGFVALLAGCGNANPHRIPATQANTVLGTLDFARVAVDAGDCRLAARRIDRARSQIARLDTSATLRDQLTALATRARSQVASDCHAKLPSPTATPSFTPSPSPTATATRSATPRPTPTSTSTPVATPTTADAGGGTTAPQDTTTP